MVETTDKIYTGETQTLYFEMWDGELSVDKPESRPDDAWLTAEQVAEITLTFKKPDATTETQTLTDDEIEPSGRAGEWRARVLLDGGAGTYTFLFDGATVDDYRAASGGKIKAKARP